MRCLVDGKYCTGQFCSPDCAAIAAAVANNSRISQSSFEELEFEEEIYDEKEEIPVEEPDISSGSSIYSISSSSSFSPAASPLLTPQSGRFQDMKFSSLFDSDSSAKVSDRKSVEQDLALPQNNYEMWLNSNY